MTYRPIQEYRIIGDMHSAALVGKNGSIDWLCFPHFDSPSAFAAILDRRRRRTAIIEREHVGDTCINGGCTPTKTHPPRTGSCLTLSL